MRVFLTSLGCSCKTRPLGWWVPGEVPPTSCLSTGASYWKIKKEDCRPMRPNRSRSSWGSFPFLGAVSLAEARELLGAVSSADGRVVREVPPTIKLGLVRRVKSNILFKHRSFFSFLDESGE
ncbi:hypothetical protein BHE74_00048723 [Ensete ventricosum]|nr:hypothetical protein BHE74_00048723 [Ensete ventricosum]